MTGTDRHPQRVIITQLSAPDLVAIRRVDERLAAAYLAWLMRAALPRAGHPLPIPGLGVLAGIGHLGIAEAIGFSYPTAARTSGPALVGIVRPLCGNLVELLSLRLRLQDDVWFPDRGLVADAVSRLFGRWELRSQRGKAVLYTFGPGPGNGSTDLLTVEVTRHRVRLYQWRGDRHEALRRHRLWAHWMGCFGPESSPAWPGFLQRGPQSLIHA